MYTRLSAVLFPVFAVLLAGTAFWGYREHQEKNSLLIKAENQYQRAFHDLNAHIDQLHEQLGNTLAVNASSHSYQRKGLINIWRITSQAQSEVNQLPLTLLPFNRTEEFLSRIANFSYKTAIRDLTKQPLTEQELATLKSLYQSAEDIAKDLHAVQQKVLADNLRWMDVELALASEDSPRDNAIIDGFKTVDNKIAKYAELDWGRPVAAMYRKRTVDILSGKPVSADDVRKKAAKLLGLDDPSAVQVTENARGTEYAVYSATVNTGDGVIQMDFTTRGGELIWYMNPREIGNQRAVSLDDAERAAREFLKERGYPEMKAIAVDPYDNAVNLTYAPVQDGAVIYPEKLTVKVALDRGEVIGLQAADYVYEHKERKLPKPAVDEAAARTKLNPEFRVERSQLAVIKNDLDEEVLCHEFAGRINGGRYKIYINAENGVEEKIERYQTAEDAGAGREAAQAG
ncbi:Germination protein YpeB [Thermobacillus xylanilyticus]|uniref:Germination protein YpeB n=1 Tax=Thermobacillus xylanilyticus TaxID=76633 RepID=A0ABM8V5A2_THEXY|nr:germination protein YpeB [Thermobacillus xylanilyticus]REJ13194.1 MAG: germination protein YpeB [Paenibacillaceae bacterium]CAG5088031.1 Germination protein YpeB [Thermobacillus xylanilyticus]